MEKILIIPFMRIALISPHFPPLCTSAAVQIRDLAKEFTIQGKEPMVIVPDEDCNCAWRLEAVDGIQVLRLAAFRTREVGYFRRVLSELSLSFVMLRNFNKSPFRDVKWDGVVWYSPPIFFGLFAWILKKKSKCKGYLIIRDIFPEWALDLGLLRRGIIYSFFKNMAALQYAVADVIGIQTPSNFSFLAKWHRSPSRRIEVLHNWLADAPNVGCSIRIAETSLAGRKVFVYAGNMGVAQGLDVFVDLAERLNHRSDIGFLFVGRGSEAANLELKIQKLCLKNVLFCKEIDSTEIPGLLSQCFVGLIALDVRHKTHNIPGKFLTYLQAGLPVIARVNPDTDLMALIERERLGYVSTGNMEAMQKFAEELIWDDDSYNVMSKNARLLAARMFSPTTAAEQIVESFSNRTIGQG